MNAVLGIEAGGSNVRASWVEAGNVIHRELLSKNLNFLSAGKEEVEKTFLFLKNVRSDISGICICMAGIGGETEFAQLEEIVKRVFPGVKNTILPDIHGAFQANFGKEVGVLVICGTGSIVLGRNATGAYCRCGGWGYLLGDEGSGFWLVKELFRNFLFYKEGLAERKSCFCIFERHFPIPNREIISMFYDARKRKEIAELAKEFLVMNDPYVLDVCRAGIEILANQAIQIQKTIDEDHNQIRFMGGIFQNETVREFFLYSMHQALRSCAYSEVTLKEGEKNIADSLALKMYSEMISM